MSPQAKTARRYAAAANGWRVLDGGSARVSAVDTSQYVTASAFAESLIADAVAQDAEQRLQEQRPDDSATSAEDPIGGLTPEVRRVMARARVNIPGFDEDIPGLSPKRQEAARLESSVRRLRKASQASPPRAAEGLPASAPRRLPPPLVLVASSVHEGRLAAKAVVQEMTWQEGMEIGVDRYQPGCWKLSRDVSRATGLTAKVISRGRLQMSERLARAVDLRQGAALLLWLGEDQVFMVDPAYIDLAAEDPTEEST
ncbi:MAG: hypothetical protein WCD35_18445 [Mycobacteriales bacterium]